MLLAFALLLTLPPALILHNTAGPGWGNACLVSPNEALTAFHVVAETPNTLGWVLAGRGVSRPATFMKRYGTHDLARVRLEGDVSLLPFYTIAKHRPDSGEALSWWVAGGLEPWLLRGWAIGMDEDGDFLVDGLSRSGMSGGCIANVRGELVAVITALQIPEDNLDRGGTFRSMIATEPVWGLK